MIPYIIRRLLLGTAVIWMVSVTVFFLMNVLPGDPAVAQLGLHYLERDRHPDLPELLADVGANRAYTQTARGGVWVVYAWRPEPPPRGEWASEPLAWPRTAEPGEVRVLAGGELVECHVCGERVMSAGHHARWRHGLSPAEYRERF